MSLQEEQFKQVLNELNERKIFAATDPVIPTKPRVIQICATKYFLYRLYDDGSVTIQHNGGSATTDEVKL